VRPRRAAGGANRTRAEARARPVGDEIVSRRANDRHVDSLELGRVLCVRERSECEQARVIGLLPVPTPALERIDQRGESYDRYVPLLISDDTTARWLLYGTAIGAVVAETIATYLGQARRGERGPRLRGLGESFAATTLGRSRGGESADRGTKRILVWSAAIGLTACLLIAINVPSLRFGANTWTTLVLGLAIAWLGVLLRVWAVWSLGRFFQRDVMIQKDHVVWRGGPYRLLRHPAYAGTLISY